MNIPAILIKVRERIQLEPNEIQEFTTGLVSGEVSDAQASAFAMAVCINGLSETERVELTLAMRDSGRARTWNLPGPVIDKHSTGGIGDNVSLVLAPILAACGAFIPMVSGRGLGHTGGTLDKLESIPGYQTQLSDEQFEKVVREVGCSIVGAGPGIAPADKRLYSIRDLTGTVESIDLVTSSILSKKLAVGLESLILDVKVGSGSFISDLKQAEDLARSLVSVSNGAGCRTIALLTDMNESLASSAGNALEVWSALRVLKNEPGEARLLGVTLALGANLLVHAGLCKELKEGENRVLEKLSNGEAADRFSRMISGQGGPADFLESPEKYLPPAKEIFEFPARKSGFLSRVNGRALGQAVIELGGGRKKSDQVLDLSVGMDQFMRIGEKVEVGDTLLRIHSSSVGKIRSTEKILSEAFEFSEQSPVESPLILKTFD